MLSRMIENALLKIVNAKQDIDMIVNLEPMTFSEVVSCILKSSIMDTIRRRRS